jgi:transglutaminase-like putative cysteine protease
MAPVQRYNVEHETRYAYTAPVSQSWQLARLTPRPLPWQRLVSHSLQIEPGADERRDEIDSFGNTVTHFGLHGAHRVLSVRMQCLVEIGERAPAPAEPTAAWEAVRDSIRHEPEQDGLIPASMCEPTPLVPYSEAAAVYAAPSFAHGTPWFDAVADLMHRIHADFEFEPGATTVSTSVDEVLYQKRGVCQDFAHLMLACLRGLGLPARYVSGYLLTDPPPGQPRLMGADASHAWVAAYAPGLG